MGFLRKDDVLEPQPKKSPFLVLNAGIKDDIEQERILRADVQQNRIEFVFPEGLAEVSLFEQCRAYCDLDNFDNMYDVTMQFLAGKHIMIYLTNYDGSRDLIGEARVVDKYQDLRIMQCIADYPIIVYWLVEFVSAMMLKKYPVPLSKPPVTTKAKGKKKKRSRKKAEV